ncbi:hypothetical protein U8607_13325 [Methylobacterium durans]|uniref:hypothetical protein n=1 Tax=Methylobacterium durans TaxID=2202825 RepID=UPI002AFFF9F7|nr:hypothetical protein [Methylobacterium durans]MEA1833063.1 hypothetical protein [Methylobacterium durans]
MSTSRKPLPEQLEMVAALTAKLADQAMAEMMSEHSVSDRTVQSLADGVLFLDRHAHPIPRLALDLLMRVHHDRSAALAVSRREGARREARGFKTAERAEEGGAGRKVRSLFRSLRRRDGA